MRCFVSYCSFACFLSVLVMVSSAPFLPHGQLSASLQIGAGAPAPSNGGTNTSTATSSTNLNGLTNILSQIDLPGLLRGVNSFVKLVGVFCPPLSQVLDNVIQNVTSTAFRVFGRLILQNGGLGGGSSGSSSGGGEQRVSVVLPTFPPDEDDYDDEDETSEISVSSSTVADRADAEETLTTVADQDTVVADQNNVVADSDKAADPNPTTLFTSSTNEETNAIVRRHVRVARGVSDVEEAEEDDQVGAESAPQPGEDLSNIEEDEQDRNKRYLPFGGHVEGQASGGSGNFLFDIIRNTADRAARTVGTVYRMVAGTENFNHQIIGGNEEFAAQSVPAFQLVAGSGATEETDEKVNAPGGVVEVDVQKSADYHHSGEGIPGPITRLFVIANRGVANLVQDLILRLAQTSERLVNFKARLITSLI